MDQAALVERARGGDEEAFAKLIEGRRDASLRFALSILRDHHTAEDAVQEAFTAAHAALPGLREPDRFGAWVRGIVRFQCYRILRARHATLVSLEDALELPVDDQRLEERVMQREEAESVRRAVGALPDSQREVARLFYLEELSQREVARWLDMPVTTVNNRLHAARKRLKGGLAMVVDEGKGVMATEQGGERGTVVGIRGPVVDVRFPDGQVPDLLTALELTDEAGRGPIAAGVTQLATKNIVRCLVTLDRRQPAIGSSARKQHGPIRTPVSSRLVAGAIAAFVDVQMSSKVQERPQLLETGIKAIDLFCPLMQGSSIGLFGDVGAGKLGVISELLHNIDPGENILSIFDFLQAGHEAAFIFTQGLPNAQGAVQTAYLVIDDPRNLSSQTFHAASSHVGAVAYMSQDMGREGLWPAVDPLRSSSSLFQSDAVMEEHRALARCARDLLQRYAQLKERTHPDDVDRLEPGEREVWSRARRLQNFLTQPMYFAEPYTKIPGQRVPLVCTLAGVKAILEGKADEVPEDTLLFVGALEDLTI